MPERADVDAWHGFLEAQNAPGAPPAVNVTQPSDSATFNCYAFNFYDPNAATGLGLYRSLCYDGPEGDLPSDATLFVRKSL